MMKLLSLSGDVSLQGSKSILQRLLLILSINPQKMSLINWSDCMDVSEMKNALIQDGFVFNQIENESNSLSAMEILPPQSIKQTNKYYFNQSATALRLWITKCCVTPNITSDIYISNDLHNRPLTPLIEILRNMGAYIEESSNKLHVIGRKLNAPSIHANTKISSQFITSLLLSSPQFSGNLRIDISQDMVSKSYLNLTTTMMQRLGIVVNQNSRLLEILENQNYTLPECFVIEPDFSSAAFFLVLGAMSKSEISVNIDYNSSIQPDKRIVDILRELGAEIRIDQNIVRIKSNKLKGGSFDLKDNPDLVPILAVTGLFCAKPLQMRNIHHLIYKESNRIVGIIKALDMIGAKFNWDGNNLTILSQCCNPRAITLDTQNDHRLLMAWTLLQIIYPQLELSEKTSVSKSCPEFYEQLARLTTAN